MATQHPWFDVYPSYVPHEIDPDHYPSIPAVLDRAAEQFPNRDAWVIFLLDGFDDGEWLFFEEIVLC